MKPKQPIGISADIFKEEYKKLGSMSRDELIVLIVLLGSLVLFATERMHGIPTPATALGALFILIMTKIITPPELNTGINWDVVMFFGVTVGLSALFGFAKVAGWFEPIIRPTILSLADNALVFMLAATLGLMLIRFIDVPWGFTTAALTAVVLIPVFNNFGIHPLVASFAYLDAINFFLLGYQQPWILMAEGMIQGRGWAPSHVTMFGLIYTVSVIVAILVSVPYWRMIGVIAN
ncbi:MAG: Sodium:sulfate symporter transmembrane region [Pelotomaculum sp. PtaB.Bin104]|nr:MAG: Sodium:sulfate symporter transmembrane region [Pelotomaculum sp. PtaB.Bin104]